MGVQTLIKLRTLAWLTGLVGAASVLVLSMAPTAQAQTTSYVGIITTWDAQTRTVTQDFQQDWPAFEAWHNTPSAYVGTSPPNAYFCPDCPTTWDEVDQLILNFPRMYRVTIPPQIFNDRLRLQMNAPAAHFNGPDLLIHIKVWDPATPELERWSSMTASEAAWARSYRIAARGKTLDFGSDGQPDISIAAGDWNVDGIELGAGDDYVDLRQMTGASYPKDLKYPRYYQEWNFKGCICGPGDDRYWGNLSMGNAGSDMGPGNDQAWAIADRGSEIIGGLGDDILHGGPWQDHLYGGDFTKAEPDGRDRLYGHGANDKVWRYSTYSTEPAYLNGGGGSDWIDGGLGNDLLVSGGGPCDRSGGDSMRGNGGHDRYIGDKCTQHVSDPWGRTIAYLFAGHDNIVVPFGPKHRIDCGEGNERFGDGNYGDWVSRWIPNTRNCELYAGLNRF